MKVFYPLIFLLVFLVKAAVAEQLDITVSGSQITISNTGVEINCCSEFESEYTIQNGTIAIVQRDTSSQKCRCMCETDLVTTISHLPKGKYEVFVYRDEKRRYGYPEDINRIIGSRVITISTYGQNSPLEYDFLQVPCEDSGIPGKNSQFMPEGGIDVYPNPASSTVTIRFDLGENSDVEINLMNFLGKKVKSINRPNMKAGIHSVTFEAPELPQGIYLGKLIASSGQAYSFKIVWSK